LEHGLICQNCIKLVTLGVSVGQLVLYCIVFNFVKVVRQHILGVMGNVAYCFVGNLIDFFSSEIILKIGKDLTKLPSQQGGAFFCDTVYVGTEQENSEN